MKKKTCFALTFIHFSCQTVLLSLFMFQLLRTVGLRAFSMASETYTSGTHSAAFVTCPNDTVARDLARWFKWHNNSSVYNICTLDTLLGTPYNYSVGPVFLAIIEQAAGNILQRFWPVLTRWLLQNIRANFLVHHFPKVFYWIDSLWMWRPLVYIELTVTCSVKPSWDDLRFVMQFVAIRCHEGSEMVSCNIQAGCDV